MEERKASKGGGEGWKKLREKKVCVGEEGHVMLGGYVFLMC